MVFLNLIKGNWISNLAVWLILLTPFFYFPHLMFPSTSSKMLVFLSAISILIFGILIHGNKIKIRMFSHPIILALGSLWIITLLSTIFSINSWLSFWGNISRASGFLVITAVFIMILLIINLINRIQVYKILSIMSVVGVLAGLYAIGQKIGLPEFLSNTFIYASSSTRVDGTFGNPLFLGSFLLITIFISLYWIVNSVQIKTKILHSISLIAQLIALLLTASRGPFLGLIVGLVVFGFFYFRNTFTWSVLTKRIVIRVILSFIILLGLIFLFRTPLGVGRLFDFELSGTIQQRLLAYESVIQGVLDRPILGYGIDNVYVAFDRNYNPELSVFGYGETFFDRAHNIFIDQLATSGFLGLIALLILGIIILYYLFRLLRTAEDKSDKLVSVMFLGIFAAYIIQGLTSFDIIANFVYGGILVSLLIVLVSKQEELTYKTHRNNWVYFGSVVLGLIFMMPIIILYLPTYNSAGLIGLALAQQRRSLYVQADINYNDALGQNSPYSHEMISYAYTDHVKSYSNTHDAMGGENNKGIAHQILLDGIKVEEQLLRREPESLQIKLFVAGLYVVLSSYDTEEARGDELFEELAIDHPNRFFLYLTWGETLVSAKRPQEALKKLEHAKSMSGATAEVDMWIGIANTITNINDNRAVEAFHVAAERELERGVRLNQILVDMIVEILIEREQFHDAIYYRKWGIENNIKGPSYMANLAVLYAQDEQYFTAKKTAEDIIREFPNNADDARAFIEALPL